MVEVDGAGSPRGVQVPLQCQRTGVQALCDELFTRPHKGDDDLVADSSWVAVRASRAWFHRVQAALVIPIQQAVDMLPGQAIGLGRCGDTELTAEDLKDDHTRFGHGRRLSPMTRLIRPRSRCNP